MSDNLSNEENPLVRKVDPSTPEATKPVVWSPEDASRFLTSAIHESQRPLADALKDRPITSKALALLVSVIVVAAALIGFILWNQMDKAEKRAETSQSQRDQALIERHQQAAKSVTLQDKLDDALVKHDALNQRVDTLRGSEDALRRAQSDMAKYRRQAELLKNQIAGLEMEKAAIQRQMDAVRAMAIDHQTEGEVPEEPENPFEAAPAKPEGLVAAAATNGAASLPLPEPAAMPVQPVPPVETAVKLEDHKDSETLETAKEPAVAKAAETATASTPENAAKAETPDAPEAKAEPELAPKAEPKLAPAKVSLEKAPLTSLPVAALPDQAEPRQIPSPEKFLADRAVVGQVPPAEVTPPESKPVAAEITQEKRRPADLPLDVTPASTPKAATPVPTDTPAQTATPAPVQTVTPTPSPTETPLTATPKVAPPPQSPPLAPAGETAAGTVPALPDEPATVDPDEEDNGPIKSTPIRLEDEPHLQVEHVAQTREDAADTPIVDKGASAP